MLFTACNAADAALGLDGDVTSAIARKKLDSASNAPVAQPDESEQSRTDLTSVRAGERLATDGKAGDHRRQVASP
jgi:hypothetical protein